MIQQYWRPTPACMQHVRRVWLCIISAAFLAFLAAPTLADAIRSASYDSWQWRGFSKSTPRVCTDVAYSPPASSGLAESDSVFAPSSSSDTSTALSLAEPASPTILYHSSLSASSVVAESASLSGYVYLDEDDNGVMSTLDWGIIDAKVELTMDGDTDPTATTYTTTDGSYTFDGLEPGVYSITMMTPCSEPGKEILGTLYDQDGHAVADAGKVAEDMFYDISLGEGYEGVKYNFAETVYPVNAYSKRQLIGNRITHTTPEPGSLVLLAVAGLILGGFAWRRGGRD